jgi:hypothetical protein
MSALSWPLVLAFTGVFAFGIVYLMQPSKVRPRIELDFALPTKGSSSSGQGPVKLETPKGDKVFSKEEVSKHNKRTDCWIIVDKVVYDVTSYIDEHPGKRSISLFSTWARELYLAIVKPKMKETYHFRISWLPCLIIPLFMLYVTTL